MKAISLPVQGQSSELSCGAAAAAAAATDEDDGDDKKETSASSHCRGMRGSERAAG